MAAQPLVQEGYRDPVTTFSTNVVGTVNVIEAARGIDSVKAVINVTTDKCYENHNEGSPFSETSRLGGQIPIPVARPAQSSQLRLFERLS